MQPSDAEPQVLLSPPDVGPAERAQLLRAFDSGWVAPVGPELTAFEEELAAVTARRAGVALSSGTAALHLALRVLGVGPGDTVLVPSLTFAATANAVVYVGATPHFVDSSPVDWTIDPVLVAELLDRPGRGARALVAVDLYGQCADYGLLEPLCAERGVVLVEDAAEGLGADHRGRPAGSFGQAAALSFNGNKIITTSGGGALVTDDCALAADARHLATQAREPVVHYEHRTVGYNYRLSNLLAALGRAQLATLDRKVAARRANNAAYRAALCGVSGIAFMPESPHGSSTWWLTCVLVDAEEFGADRDAVLEHLAARGVEARPAWKPMHLQPAFAGLLSTGGAVSEDVFSRGLCLPSGSMLTEAQRARVVDGLLTTPRLARQRR